MIYSCIVFDPPLMTWQPKGNKARKKAEARAAHLAKMAAIKAEKEKAEEEKKVNGEEKSEDAMDQDGKAPAPVPAAQPESELDPFFKPYL